MLRLTTARAVAFVLVLPACGYVLPAANADTDVDQQRQNYLAALQALDADDLVQFDDLYQQLDGYALQGYLRYAFLKNRLANTAPAKIRRFLQENEYAPVSAQLRERWLTQLASRADWETFLEEYRPLDNPTLRCLRLRQLLKANESPSELAPEIERLWLTNARLPSG
ncbi:MAG: hypothetical protein ACE5LB_14010, partial [Acidiferrobacterales bacterium]